MLVFSVFSAWSVSAPSGLPSSFSLGSLVSAVSPALSSLLALASPPNVAGSGRRFSAFPLNITRAHHTRDNYTKALCLYWLENGSL